MAEVTYNLRIDRLERDITAELMGNEIYEEMLDLGKAVKAEIRELILERAEVNSADGLAESLVGDIDRADEDEWSVIVFSESDHALWFEEGTGIFGPRNQPITPKIAPFMVFRHRGLGRKVYALKVRGQEAHHPFRDGLEAVMARR